METGYTYEIVVSHAHLQFAWRIFIYYINARTMCVCMCPCVCSSEISGTGSRSATLLAPTWRASLGKLQRLLLKLTRRMVWKKKPFEFFPSNPWNHTLFVTMVRYFKNWSFSWVRLSFFSLNWDAARKKSIFAVWEALLKLGGSCGVRKTGCG